MDDEMDWYVSIVEDATDEPNTVMGPMSKRRADRVADGAGINLNHEAWHIDVRRKAQMHPDWLEKAR